MSENSLLGAMFIQQRIQVMHIGKHYGEFSDSYLFAWESGVYPFLSDTDGSVPSKPHEPYADFFQTSKEKGEFLIKHLDDAWRTQEKLTFYALEDQLINSGNFLNWSRSDLLDLCRYFYLDRRFDEAFWQTMITPMQCPVEAYGVIGELDRSNDIRFM